MAAYSSSKKLAPSPICNCGLEDQTTEHILQRCPLLQTARTNVWPTAVQLHTKLWQQGGTGEDSFIHLAHWTLSVAVMEKKCVCCSLWPNSSADPGWSMHIKAVLDKVFLPFCPCSHPPVCLMLPCLSEPISYAGGACHKVVGWLVCLSVQNHQLCQRVVQGGIAVLDQKSCPVRLSASLSVFAWVREVCQCLCYVSVCKSLACMFTGV